MATRGKPADTDPLEPANFYAGDSTSGSEHEDLARARLLEGLEDEIALLRVKLKEATRAEPVDFALLLRGTEILIRAVTAQYRLSPRAGKNITSHLTALLNDLGDHILPADH